MKTTPPSEAADKQEPATIFLILPAPQDVTRSTWLRLCIASALQNLMRDTHRA